jgi:hypothetical protein
MSDTQTPTPAQPDEISEEQLEEVAGGTDFPTDPMGPFRPWEPTPTFPIPPYISSY